MPTVDDRLSKIRDRRMVVTFEKQQLCVGTQLCVCKQRISDFRFVPNLSIQFCYKFILE